LRYNKDESPKILRSVSLYSYPKLGKMNRRYTYWPCSKA
jgi:hypothetical protein